VGVAFETGFSCAEEQAVECEMYSTNANPIYANQSDKVILNIFSADNVTVSAVTISEWAARKRTGTSEWEVDGNCLWPDGYLSFEISYTYTNETGNEINGTQDTLTSGIAVLLDKEAPVNIAPTMQAERSDAIRVTANVKELEGCVAPAHEYGYSFILYGEAGNPVDSLYGYTKNECLFEGLKGNTRYKASTRIRDAAGNAGNFSGLTFIRTLSADPLSLSVSERTNTSLSYVMDSSNQTEGTENKVILTNAGGVVSETAFGQDTSGTFDGLSEGGKYQIKTITRNSDSVENAPHLFWTGTTKHLPSGAIVLPKGDIFLKDGEVFTMEGTYEDADGDDVAITAHMGETAGKVNVGTTTWSAVWSMDGFPEGLQPGISVSLSDSGGTGETVLNWTNDLTIDRTSPQAPEISADPGSLTSGSVLVSILGEENASIFYSVDGNTALPYENAFSVSENAEIKAFQRDEAGNSSTESSVTIDWIDKTEPSGSISYNTSLPTNGPVVATLTTIDENKVEITNNGGSNQYEFTTNGSFTFEFRDAAGNTGSKAAQVTWIDTLAPNAPSIHLNPESGVSTGSVEIAITHNEAPEDVSIEYGIAADGEIKWLPYESPFSVSEKGSWDVFARAIDTAGNASPESRRSLILKNRHKSETVEPSRAVDHYDINLPYLLAQGTTLEKSVIGSFYDIDGKPIEISGFEIESSNPYILQIMDDGTIFAKNPGVVSLIVSDPETEAVFTFDLEIDGPPEKIAGVEFSDTKDHWAKDSISGLSDEGYICGYGDGSFRPQSNITVAECLTILERVRLDNATMATSTRPCEEPEIIAEAWSRNYCLSALSRMDMDEVKNAFGDKIDADVPATRGQVAFLLAQSENWIGAFEDAIPFDDIMCSRYCDPILCAFNRGIFKGYPDGTFKPDDLITRAETTVLFGRFIEYLN